MKKSFLYCNRVTPKANFRAMVYSKDSKKQVNNYEEFANAINSKEWYETPQEALRVKNGNSKTVRDKSLQADKSIKPHSTTSRK